MKIKVCQNNFKFGMNADHTPQVHTVSFSSIEPIGNEFD